jgi:hypothetical protein
VAFLQTLTRISLAGLRNTTQNLSKNSRFPGSDLKLELLNAKQKCSPLNRDVRNSNFLFMFDIVSVNLF